MRVGTRDSGKAFTLIELLIVMVIISVLIAILVPAVMVPKGLVRTMQIMKALESALASYEATFGMFPPSQMPTGYSGTSGVGTGAQCLYYFLMGPNETGWGTASADGGLSSRYIWGPAKDLDQTWMVAGGEGSVAEYFSDGDPSKDKALLYYRADITIGSDNLRPVRYDEVYDRSDNNGSADGPFWSPSGTDWEELIKHPYSQHDAPYNARTYLLIGAGVDREFGFVDGVCDDILNVKRID